MLLATTGVAVETVPLKVTVTGVVVRVSPLYIIVIDGHMVPLEKGPPDLGKQYCSKVESADAVVEAPSLEALLQPSRALVVSRRTYLVMMQQSSVVKWIEECRSDFI